MQISYNWLKEYVDFDYRPEELAYVLTFLGLEVDTMEEVGKGLETIMVGEVLSVKPHPRSDRLVISDVQVGEEIFTIVVGVDNMRVGDKVPVAVPGSTLPHGRVIKEIEIRGVSSRGMLCSADELNLSEESEEILLLPKEVQSGFSLEVALKLHDYILFLDLTPNYGHCLSMLGVAREVGAKVGEPVDYRVPELVEEGPPIEEMASVEIYDQVRCPRYSARIIEGVKIGPSPFWLQQRLRTAGVRPINNVVDITNYVMLELGQPLHAFDYDKIDEHQVIVRQAKKGETLVTLDEEKRDLLEEDLVIGDPREGIALAGVMGGYMTEVTEATTNIFLESAHFQPTTVRRTSRRLGLPSEASQRFERGVDIEGTCRALDRAAAMLRDIAGGTVAKGIIDVYPEPKKEKAITLRMDRIERVLGLDISSSTVKSTLESLGFSLQGEELFTITIPTYRMDIEEEIDLIEEVARHHGYDTIPQELPQSMGQGRLTPIQKMERKVRSLLEAMGLWESITYSFVNPKKQSYMKVRGEEKDWLYLKNPLSEDLSVMRTTLLLGLIETLSLNQKRHHNKVSLYELGKVFLLGHGGTEEILSLGAISSKEEDPWDLGAGSFYYLKGVLEELFASLLIKDLSFEEGEYPFLHPKRQAHILLEGKRIGLLGEIHVDTRKAYDIKQPSSCFELDLSPLLEKEGEVVKYKSIPRFPSISRDLALVVHEETTSQSISAIMTEEGGDLLKRVEVFDLYHGPQLGEGEKSLAYTLNFYSQERTLTDEEVDSILHSIIGALEEKLSARVRA